MILCVGKTANIPFLLKKPGVHVYTAEELCYCIREHTFLMDEEVVCKELADWLGEECGLPELADTLHTMLKKNVTTEEFLTEVLVYTGYYPREEIRRLSRFLRSSSARSEYENRKDIGDYLAGNGKYELAMEQYRRLLADVSGDAAFSARVLHNMGCVCCRLFLFERAAELFYRAYEAGGEQENLIRYLAAKRLSLDEKGYLAFMATQPKACYEASMELEKRVQQVACKWEESIQNRQLEAVRQEITSHPQEAGRVWEDAAQQMKESFLTMMREN